MDLSGSAPIGMVRIVKQWAVVSLWQQAESSCRSEESRRRMPLGDTFSQALHVRVHAGTAHPTSDFREAGIKEPGCRKRSTKESEPFTLPTVSNRSLAMPDHIVVVGATGLVGRAAMEHYATHGFKVTAVSRRRPTDTYGAAHVSVDLDDKDACEKAFGGLSDVVQIVYAALYEEPELVAGWTKQEHVDKNGRMLKNVVEPIDKASPTLRNVVLLQGPKAYGVHTGQMVVGAREDRDEVRSIPNFYWSQQDYLTAKQVGRPWGWTVVRPSLVVGMGSGSAMNIISALGIYGALLKREGLPLNFPGGITSVIEATDTDLMARMFEWCKDSPKAHNQTFNLTNGDVFTIRAMWPVFADCMGMKVGPDVPMMLSQAMPGRAKEWDAVREEYKLTAPDLPTFAAQSFQFADFVLAHGVTALMDPSLMSVVKIREAGFHEVMHSDDMFRKWFKRYQAEGLLPPVKP
ncbi:hypothetical protein DFJ74DRAFT_91350 [Hyaloraphidium curvatum]|nr:hypothetical protein DFJ74DRAFT_91350 [Hyaloraphidium curvatum]